MKNTIFKTFIFSALIGIALNTQAYSAETQPKEQSAKQFFSEIKKNFPADKLDKIELCFTPSMILTSQYSTESRVCFEAEEKTAFIFDIDKSEYKKLQDSLFQSEGVTKPRIEIPKNQLKTVIEFTFENKKTFFISEYLISTEGIWLKTKEKSLRLNLSKEKLNQIIKQYMINMRKEHVDMILQSGFSILSDGKSDYVMDRISGENGIELMREALKGQIKYEINNRVYTMTFEDISILKNRNVEEYYDHIKKRSGTLFRKPYIFPMTEPKNKNTIHFNTFNIDDYKKGEEISLIPKYIIQKTNNLSFYLANNTDKNGDPQSLGFNSETRIYRLKSNKEYSKKIDIIENHYPLMEKLSKLKMKEFKQKFLLSSAGVSFALSFKKDFSEVVHELYFLKRSNNTFIVVDKEKNKFYYLFDKNGVLSNFLLDIFNIDKQQRK